MFDIDIGRIIRPLWEALDSQVTALDRIATCLERLEKRLEEKDKPPKNLEQHRNETLRRGRRGTPRLTTATK